MGVEGVPARSHGDHHIGVRAGEPAPDFVLPDQDNVEFRLSALRGVRAAALFFYPLDWSPMDVQEQQALSRDLDRFDPLAEVAAISVDSLWSHRAFARHYGLRHRLLTDIHRSVSRAYGLLIEPLNFSQRATVVVSKDGQVAWYKVQPNISQPRDMREVLEVLEGLSRDQAPSSKP